MKLKKNQVFCGMAALLGLSVMFSNNLGMQKVYAASPIAIDSTNFPDYYFCEFVETNLNTDGVPGLSDAELAAVTEIDVSRNQIRDLTGIEYFTNLQTLKCAYQFPDINSVAGLEILDVSQNINLTYLDCGQNELATLDVSQNTNLTYLDCAENHLSTLDVSSNTALTHLECDTNKEIGTLDVSRNINLTHLQCGACGLADLDVSQNTLLTYLGCAANYLTTLDVSHNSELEELYCYWNELTALDMSHNPKLALLWCDQQRLNNFNFDLDITKNRALTNLMCGDNNMTNLNVSQNVALTYLECQNNLLDSLDVSQNVELYHLYCNNNQLTQLDISKNTGLIYLDCSNNQLSSLDASQTSIFYGEQLGQHTRWDNNQISAIMYQEPGRCYIDLSSCPMLDRAMVSNVSKGTYDAATGQIDFVEPLSVGDTLTYDYATGNEDNKMTVQVTIAEIHGKDATNEPTSATEVTTAPTTESTAAPTTVSASPKTGDGKIPVGMAVMGMLSMAGYIFISKKNR